MRQDGGLGREGGATGGAGAASGKEEREGPGATAAGTRGRDRRLCRSYYVPTHPPVLIFKMEKFFTPGTNLLSPVRFPRDGNAARGSTKGFYACMGLLEESTETRAAEGRRGTGGVAAAHARAPLPPPFGPPPAPQFPVS